MKSAIHIGLSLSDYNEMTPYELNLKILDYNEKRKREDEDKLTLVWLGEYWHRIKKLPPLKEVLGHKGKPKQMTNEEMLNEVKRLNAALGGEVR
ncbi:hypothetical protein [Bacillus sp. FJAT-29814]|uniref:hypothetical protein n=1 Tax=Bacillus sp. FJAT-29814 TaxID=1729688 RepID=UPI000836D476|nr:hypothetical protein [Bacillus sp. FJAT-29814]